MVRKGNPKGSLEFEFQARWRLLDPQASVFG